MDVATLTKLFNTCILLGFSIPLLNLAIGVFGSVFDLDLDLDHDADIDGPIPFNIMSICLALIVFGALGRFTEQFITSQILMVIVLVVLTTVSMAVYVIFYKSVVARLKNNNPSALTHDELVGRVGTITLRIAPNSDGMISITDSVGANISIKQGLVLV